MIPGSKEKRVLPRPCADSFNLLDQTWQDFDCDTDRHEKAPPVEGDRVPQEPAMLGRRDKKKMNKPYRADTLCQSTPCRRKAAGSHSASEAAAKFGRPKIYQAHETADLHFDEPTAKSCTEAFRVSGCLWAGRGKGPPVDQARQARFGSRSGSAVSPEFGPAGRLRAARRSRDSVTAGAGSEFRQVSLAHRIRLGLELLSCSLLRERTSSFWTDTQALKMGDGSCALVQTLQFEYSSGRSTSSN